MAAVCRHSAQFVLCDRMQDKIKCDSDILYVFFSQDPDSTDFNVITCNTPLDGKRNSLAASFVVGPNMIVFSSVWANFANIGQNAVVFCVVLGGLIVYTILLLWAARKDKKDRTKVCVFSYFILCIMFHLCTSYIKYR